MRPLLFWIILLTAAALLPAGAQENLVTEFSGIGTTTTPLFKVHDRWEVRWNARQVVSVAVMASDGTIVAGGAGVLRGSLFLPLGGTFYFKVTDGTVGAPTGTNAASATPPASDGSGSPPPGPVASWHLQVVELGPAIPANQALTVYTPFFAVPDSAVTPVAPTAPPPRPELTAAQTQAMVTIKGDNNQGAGFLVHTPDGSFVLTHLHLLAANPNIQIFTRSGELITTTSLKGAVDRDLAMFAIKDDHFSYLSIPAADDHAASLDPGDSVLVPGSGPEQNDDAAPPGTAPAAVPPAPPTTPSTAPSTTAALAPATTPSPTAPSPAPASAPSPAATAPATPTAATAPPAVAAASSSTNSPTPSTNPAPSTPAAPAAGAAALVAAGGPSILAKVMGVTPERLDFDAAFGPDSNGAPVIQVKSGKAVAILTAQKKVDVSLILAKAWPANPVPGVDAIIPYYGLRVGDVPQWETYDPARFLSETLFLKQFHQDTRCLDSYLNGRRPRRHFLFTRSFDGMEARPSFPVDAGAPDNKFFMANDKIRKANDTYHQLANGADQNQRLEGARELLFDLQAVVDTDVSALQDTSGLYAYDQTWAKEELAYRGALKQELDQLSDNITRLDNIARSH